MLLFSIGALNQNQPLNKHLLVLNQTHRNTPSQKTIWTAFKIAWNMVAAKEETDWWASDKLSQKLVDGFFHSYFHSYFSLPSLNFGHLEAINPSIKIISGTFRYLISETKQAVPIE